MNSDKTDLQSRVQKLEISVKVIQADVRWIKNLGFGFFGLLAVNIVLNILNIANGGL